MRYEQEMIEMIAAQPEAARASAEAMQTYIAGSTAIYHGEPIKTLLIPKIFSAEAYEALKECGKTTYRILEKITDHYLEDPAYRALFPYPDGLEELVRFERGYSCRIPICRLDIFFNEEDLSFKYCEINTDGTSGMVEDLELNRALEKNQIFTQYKESRKLRIMELYDSFVKVLLEVYKDWSGGKENMPRVAIVDFLGDSYFSDFLHFKAAFEKAGCICSIEEITKLTYEKGKLLAADGSPIDAVYRRAVTTDVFAARDQIVPFLSAVKDGAVCCVGSFCTQVAHNKSMFKIIRDPETFAFLTPEEQDFVEAHFPFTGYLSSESTGTAVSLEEVIQTKDRWILKPLDLYGAREISVGSDFTQEAWKAKVNELTDQGYIFQEYCHPYRTDNVIPELYTDADAKTPEVSSWINMTGLYMYGGNLAGFFSRLAPDKVIAGHYGGRTIATLVEEK